ncbi:DUF4232 domain-containing protein [Streptomyces sp. NPDC090994]|uniref:DUF4232 domain-containing protein n=1 Tax=Streptomyces sp. NPDC090994 TaxID=3365969 RepID=UPI003821DEBA
MVLHLTNTSDTACALKGFPGVDLKNDDRSPSRLSPSHRHHSRHLQQLAPSRRGEDTESTPSAVCFQPHLTGVPGAGLQRFRPVTATRRFPGGQKTGQLRAFEVAQPDGNSVEVLGA